MSGAARLGAGEVKESGRLYDWPATIGALKGVMGASKDKHVAWELNLGTSFFAQIKHGLRPMPKEALQMIRERWPEALKTIQASKEGQAVEEPQDGPKVETARVVATTPVLLKKFPTKNMDLTGVKNKVTDLFKEGFAG